MDFFEIISENFMVDGGLPLANLDRICERYPVVLHGVSLSIASADATDLDYLDRLKALAVRTDAPWFTDHLCWTAAGGSNTHDLLPIPYTEENANYIGDRAAFVQDRIGLPFGLENLSSYLTFQESEMEEWEFLRAVVERADCGILLDVNNIHVSAVNHGFDPLTYLDAVPFERVIEIHVAGQRGSGYGILLDTHDDHVKPEVWELYRIAHERSGGASTLLEWDEHHLSFAETHAEARKALAFQERHGEA